MRRPRRAGRRVSPIRTFPWVRAPIAASTWEGVSELALQADPLATAKPARSSSRVRVSPSRYKTLNVSRCGTRRSGSPTTSTSGTSAAIRDRIRSISARCRDSDVRALPEPGLQRDRGGEHRGHVRWTRPAAALVVIGGVRRAPPRRATQGRAPLPRSGRRRPTRRPPAPTTGRRRSGRSVPVRWWRRAAAAPRRSAQISPASTYGCRVPTSWFATCRQASATPSAVDRRAPRGQVDPAHRVDPHGDVPAAGHPMCIR